MQNLGEDRIPKAWIGREVAVRTRGPAGEAKEMFGKLEDAHEGGVVLSGVGPTQTAEAEPGMFYPWSAMEALRLQVPPTDRPDPHEEDPRSCQGVRAFSTFTTAHRAQADGGRAHRPAE